MKREFCEHCPALVAGENDEWICDYSDKEVELMEDCPELL